ncbi:MAG TPA: PsbP-related protein, partial [Nitrososphaeraceae archaeon]|nr:PsbP-related protein [Nitrososphaeraceae archaeon]
MFSLVLLSTNPSFAVTIEGNDEDINSPTNLTLNTFKDAKSGISFQYPSDWEVASDEYIKSSDPPDNTVVLMIPKYDDPSSMLITQEELPVPISSDEYVEQAKLALSGERISIGDAIPVSINSLEGSKYNITGGKIIQTHVLIVRDTTAINIAYFIYPKNVAKNLEDIESMINSFEIESAATDSAEEDDSLVFSNDKDLDNAKETINELLIYAFNSFFPETEEKFSNTEHGVDMTLPKNWTGIEWKIIFPLAIVSPEGINVTDLFSTEISASTDSIVDEINSGGDVFELVDQKMQDLNKPVITKLLQYFTDRTSSMAIYIYNKEFARDMNSFSSNDTLPINSQASLYERHFFEST